MSFFQCLDCAVTLAEAEEGAAEAEVRLGVRWLQLDGAVGVVASFGVAVEAEVACGAVVEEDGHGAVLADALAVLVSGIVELLLLEESIALVFERSSHF